MPPPHHPLATALMVALLALSHALASGVSLRSALQSRLRANPEAATCSCTAQCNLTGDPHLVSFYGDQKTLVPSDGALLVYEVGSTEVTATTSSGSGYITSVAVGGTTYSASDCKTTGQTMGPFTYDVDGDTLEVGMQCVRPENTGKHGNEFHLNVAVGKTDVGSGDFASLEQARQATGACTDGVNQAGSGKGYCSCEATCLAKGDPHLTSFYGSQELLSDDQDVLYAEGDDSFSLVVSMYSDVNYIGRVDYDGNTYVSDQCDNSGEVLAKDYISVPTGTVFVKVWCQFPSKGGPAHLNVKVEKNAAGTKGESFTAVEEAAGSSGKCMDQTS